MEDKDIDIDEQLEKLNNYIDMIESRDLENNEFMQGVLKGLIEARSVIMNTNSPLLNI